MKKFILITGCSSGIGLTAATLLQARGYAVIASVRRAQDQELVRQAGIQHVLTLDLADSASIDQAITETLDIAQGQLFALFNNGAFGLPGAVEDLTRDALRFQFETNFFGTHELTQKLLPTFLRQTDARIIYNSSVLGFAAMPFRGAYVASKFALEGLCDCLRMELTGTPVKIVLLEPGPIATAFRANALRQFQHFINPSSSRHATAYQAAAERLASAEAPVPFTLPPEAVVAKLILALEKPYPQPRYYVTLPTYLMGLSKRLLSTAWMDKVVRLTAKA